MRGRMRRLRRLRGGATPPPLPRHSDRLDERSDEDCRLIYDFTLTILDKKYDLYNWTEMKINTLISVNGILIGGSLVLASRSEVDFGTAPTDYLLIGTPLAVLILSLVLCLMHIVPQMDSGIGNQGFRNLRQVAGTQLYSPHEYLDALSRLTLRDMIIQNSNQIKGMNAIIMRNQRILRRAVTATIGGVFLLTIWIAYQL
jgi:hypothetical protein